MPIPSGPDLGTISATLVARLDARAAAVRDAEERTIADRFADERASMLPLPPVPFVAAAFRVASGSRRSLVKLDGAVYSVWSSWAGLDMRAYVGRPLRQDVGRPRVEGARDRARRGGVGSAGAGARADDARRRQRERDTRAGLLCRKERTSEGRRPCQELTARV